MKLNFDAGSGQLQNWLVAETQFDDAHLPKIESIFAQGNGYLGFRATTEEVYVESLPNCFVAGTFNLPQGEFEVPELPNTADFLNLQLFINGVRFALDKGTVLAYERVLDLRQGEVRRTAVWQSPTGEQVELRFQRIMALHDRHLFATQVEIVPLNGEMEISVRTGLDGRMSNSGVQHFVAGEMRFFEKKIGRLHQTTAQSNIDFVHCFTVNAFVNDQPQTPPAEMFIGRREMQLTYRWMVAQGERLVVEKFANTFTSRDNDMAQPTVERLKSKSLTHIEAAAAQRYTAVLAAHEAAWAQYWEQQDVAIVSERPFDQLALRFALYHLRIMTPLHDERMGIGAKGYTGEGYKGHSFWDTEIYIFPFWLTTQPKVARSLLHYRQLLLPGARQKALDNGYAGAMYPWETAWITDGEVTPEWGNVDHLTGEREKIWTGFIQQHISADIVYALWRYVTCTGDDDFFERFGRAMVFETAVFWLSRLEWNPEKGRYEINNVIGPDEYKEHVNNNAFTNHMAHWNIQLAQSLAQSMRTAQPDQYVKFNQNRLLDKLLSDCKKKLPLFYLPQPNTEHLIPQDDSYLTLPDLPNLQSFKQAGKVMTIFKRYSMPQLSGYQVSKQADLIVLFVLLPKLFSQAVQEANFAYYESKTLHDSSLSYAMHALLAARLGRTEQAYQFWQRACQVDLSQNMAESHGGIHAAAMGGIWQGAVLGFGGLYLDEAGITLKPKLPSAWQKLSYPFVFRGSRFRTMVTQTAVSLHCLAVAAGEKTVRINGRLVTLQVGEIFSSEENEKN